MRSLSAAGQHYDLVERAQSELVSVVYAVLLGSGLSRAAKIPTGWEITLDLSGTLLLYALGLGAVEAGRFQLLGYLFATPVYREGREDIPAVQLLPPFCLFEQGRQVARILDGMDRRYASLNDWLHDVLRKSVERIIPNNTQYTFVFDKLEVLIALGFAFHAKRTSDWYWAPPGAFGYRSDNRERVLQEIEQSMSSKGDLSPFVKSGIFGNNVETCNKGLAVFREFIVKISGSWD